MTANRHQRRAAEKAAQEPGASQETKQEAAAVALEGTPVDEQSQEDRQQEASEQAGTAESSSPPAEPISAAERPQEDAPHDAGDTIDPASQPTGGHSAPSASQPGGPVATEPQHTPDGAGSIGEEEGSGNDGAPAVGDPSNDGSAAEHAGEGMNDSDGSADGDPFADQPDEAEVTPNVLAAAGAASMAYGTDIRDLRVDVSWLRPIGGNRPSLIRRANVLAKFIRDNPEAPYHAGVIHLQRSGFPEVPDAEPRGLVAYQVFATTLNALDRIDADAARAAEPKSDGKPAPIFADAGGMMPETGGLTAGGYGSL